MDVNVDSTNARFRNPRNYINDVGTRGDGAVLVGLNDASDTSTHVRTRTNLGR